MSVGSDGAGVVVVLELVLVARSEPVGADPKAIAYSGLTCKATATGQWQCRATIDV